MQIQLRSAPPPRDHAAPERPDSSAEHKLMLSPQQVCVMIESPLGHDKYANR